VNDVSSLSIVILTIDHPGRAAFDDLLRRAGRSQPSMSLWLPKRKAV
jgi:hypothetical protein